MKKVRIVYVSVFSGADFFAMGFKRNGVMPGYSVENNKYAARVNMNNHKYSDGTVLIKTVEVAEGDVERLQLEKYEMEQVDGKWFRYQRIQDVNGQDIRAEIVNYYGKDVKIIYLGGCPCQDFSRLNQIDKGRRNLVFEYLRVLGELLPDVCIMEEVADILSPKHKTIWDEFIKQARLLPYQIGYLEMNALNYNGSQSRKRLFVQAVRADLYKKPLFPEPTQENVKRFGDIIKDADYFFSGNFTDKIKGRLDWMVTLTSSSPVWFGKKDGNKIIKRDPTLDELLLFQGVQPGELLIPTDISYIQMRKVIGNGVEVNLSELLAKTIIEKVFELKHVGNGWFVPIDTPDDGTNRTVNPVEVIPPGDTQEKPSMSEQPHGANDPVMSVKKMPQASPPDTKIISSQQLINMEFTTLNFSGKWNYLFGNPSTGFYCIIHGLSGSGKSTFSVQFAKYLADNIGKVLYISGEEGFSKTLQNKLVMTNSESPALYVAQLKTYTDIMREVKPNAFPFIIIDSLNHMGIDAEKMKQIRAVHNNTAFIAIAQSTKAGEMRGSYELIHDCDIEVKVESGLAYTNKNRFKETGTTFNVFEILPGQEPVDKGTEPANVAVKKAPIKRKYPKNINELERLLKEAVASEDYLTAAKIRDMISKLKNK